MPQKPASASAFTVSQGYCSSRSMAAARGRATVSEKSRARFCSAISSGERPRSICFLSQSDAIYTVMPALVAGIHALRLARGKDVDGRAKPGHDEERAFY